MATAPMQFGFTFGKPQGQRRVEDEDPFRVLVLADLGCAMSARGATPLARRRALSVDIDNLDAVFRRLKPCVALQFDGKAVTIEFESLEDFHPDRLFAHLAPFVALRQLRGELADPAQFRRAAASLGASPSTAGAPDAPAAPDAGADAGDIERLLGRMPAAAPVAVAGPGGSGIDAWLRSVVAPHVVQDLSSEQAPLIAAVDAAIAEQMRRVLHDPAFQALEANWRNVERLVRELDLGDTLQLMLLDATRDELAQDFQAHASDLSESALHHHLCGSLTQAPDGAPWSLLVSDLAFGADLSELQMLATLGAMAGRAGAPLLAAARLSLIGCAHIGQLAEPKRWQPLVSDAAAYWSALRQSPVAPWVGLALPRLLARLPYGKSSDPVVSFAFEEQQPRAHDAYLWGSPAFSLGLLAGQSFLEAGWGMELGAGQDVDDLPGHVFREDGESHQQAGAEVTLNEPAADAVLRQGVMALLSYRNRNAARLLLWQSIASPAQALRGPWADAGR
jgi:type VI secretion system protein ImpC